MENAAMCNFGGAHWLLFGPNVPPLIYYSHIPNIIFALFLAFYILFKGKKELVNKVLFFTILAFELWVFFALMFWATNRSDMVLFTWSMDILVEPLVYMGALYLLYLLIDRQDISFSKKALLALLYAPIAIFLPTKFMLSGFDLSSCLAIEGPVALYYSYFVEIFVTIWIIYLCVSRFFKATDKVLKREIVYLGIGTILLLVAFAWGNIIGSFSENWQLGDYGLFGMPVFLAFLVYSIVKFRIFNIKIIGTTALVVALWIATASLLTIDNISTIRNVLIGTLILIVIVGWNLIRSVHKEIYQREELAIANEGQENLIHIMNHQIKGYLGKAKNIFAELVSEPDYCASESAKPMLSEGLKSVTEGVDFIQQVLNGSNAARGTLTYTMKPLDFKTLVTEMAEKQKSNADEKKLAYTVSIAEGNYNMNADELQLKEAVKNLIDNSIRYTPSGSIDVHLSSVGGKALLAVKDTGVGIAPEDKPKLFTKGGRGKDSLKYNVNSTGYGLAFVKGVIDAHKGRVWAESEGPGMGSTFFMELPLIS